MNTVWLDKCFKAAEMLYGVFPFGVLERLYGGKLDQYSGRKMQILDHNLKAYKALIKSFKKSQQGLCCPSGS